jgi:putative nucleotidyltransferase with HDIG domain
MLTDKNKNKPTSPMDGNFEIGPTATAMSETAQRFDNNAPDTGDTLLTIPKSDVSLEDEIDRLAQALSLKFEELTLIHQFSERLKIGEDAADVCQSLLEELAPCINASTIAIDLYQDDDLQCERIFLFTGERWDENWLGEVASYATSVVGGDICAVGNAPVAILNSPAEDSPAFVRTVVIPIQRDGMSLGRMIAVRPIQEDEFGTVEADLMKSTSMILAAHLINQRQYMEMQQMFEGMIQSLASALDAKDSYTSGHSSRVAELATMIARRLGFDQDGINRIRMAGILHDIGKIGIADSVLRKPGQLTEDEFEQIKHHPVLGYEILKGIKPFRNILPAVRHHHESWDGSGYPDGLAGDGIPLDAQVLAVADAFDAMTSDRPYRSGMTMDKVVGIFKDGRGTQWAAAVVDVLLASPEILNAKRKNPDSDA